MSFLGIVATILGILLFLAVIDGMMLRFKIERMREKIADINLTVKPIREALKTQRDAMLTLYTEEDARRALTELAERIKHINLLLAGEEQKEKPDENILLDLEIQLGKETKRFFDKRNAIFMALGLEFSINPNEYKPKILQ